MMLRISYAPHIVSPTNTQNLGIPSICALRKLLKFFKLIDSICIRLSCVHVVGESQSEIKSLLVANLTAFDHRCLHRLPRGH